MAESVREVDHETAVRVVGVGDLGRGDGGRDRSRRAGGSASLMGGDPRGPDVGMRDRGSGPVFADASQPDRLAVSRRSGSSSPWESCSTRTRQHRSASPAGKRLRWARPCSNRWCCSCYRRCWCCFPKAGCRLGGGGWWGCSGWRRWSLSCSASCLPTTLSASTPVRCSIASTASARRSVRSPASSGSWGCWRCS